jgi:hypothetical protein
VKRIQSKLQEDKNTIYILQLVVLIQMILVYCFKKELEKWCRYGRKLTAIQLILWQTDQQYKKEPLH